MFRTININRAATQESNEIREPCCTQAAAQRKWDCHRDDVHRSQFVDDADIPKRLDVPIAIPNWVRMNVLQFKVKILRQAPKERNTAAHRASRGKRIRKEFSSGGVEERFH